MKEVNIYRQELDYSANESYKSLRTNLLFCGEDKKVIAVTSCTPNEGKSTVSLNLALSLADSGTKAAVYYAGDDFQEHYPFLRGHRRNGADRRAV